MEGSEGDGHNKMSVQCKFIENSCMLLVESNNQYFDLNSVYLANVIGLWV